MENKEPNQSLATFNGGMDVSVQTLDGNTESVKVLQLSIGKIQEFFTALELGPGQLAALLCGKTVEWANTISAKGIFEIIEKGRAVNQDFFGLMRQRMELLDAVLPGSVQRAIDKASINTSPSMSPEPASTGRPLNVTPLRS